MVNKHYVYVDSRNRNKTEPVNNFTVHLHNPIKNVVRCGVVNFVCPNTSYNVHALNNKFEWFEVYLDTTANTTYYYRTFAITLDIGYYNISKLCQTIVDKMNATTDRTNTGESPTLYTFSPDDDDYRISITGASANSAAANRYWGFLMENDDKVFNNSIVHHILSYSRSQVLTREQLDTIGNLHGGGEGVTTKVPTDGRFAQALAQSRTNLTPEERTLKANFSYSENQSLIHLASDILSENSSRMVLNNGKSDTMKTNILESINVTVNRWSYISMNKSANDILYHSLEGINISHFDLKLLNEHYLLFPDGDASTVEFKACIVFETSDDTHHAAMTEMYRNYNISGYRQAH